MDSWLPVIYLAVLVFIGMFEDGSDCHEYGVVKDDYEN